MKIHKISIRRKNKTAENKNTLIKRSQNLFKKALGCIITVMCS